MSAIAGDLEKLKVFEPLLTRAVVLAARKMNHPKLASVEKVVLSKLSKNGVLCLLQVQGSNLVHYRRISPSSLEQLRKLQGGNQEMIQTELGTLAAQWVRLHLVFNVETGKPPVEVGDITRVTISIHRKYLDASKTVTNAGPIVGIVLFNKQKFEAQELIETGMKCRAIYDQGKKEYEIPEKVLPMIGIHPPLLQKAIQADAHFLRSLVGFEYSYYRIRDIFHPEETGEKTSKLYLGKKLTVEKRDEHKA